MKQTVLKVSLLVLVVFAPLMAEAQSDIYKHKLERMERLKQRSDSLVAMEMRATVKGRRAA